MKMTYLEKREMMLPADAVRNEYKDIKTDVYTYENTAGYVAVMFGGKRTKKDWAYRFETDEKRQNYINKQLLLRHERVEADKAYKAERKAKENELFKTVKVGDVFVESGGYDQTNVYFYQLVELKGKTGTFRRIHKETVPGTEGMMCCNVVPAVNAFIDTPDKAMKKRITGNRFKAGYYNAYKTDINKEHYNSWYA